jgi:hypothetical protein
MTRSLLMLLAAATAAPALALAPAPAPSFDPDAQASIPFVNHRHAIRDFEAPSDDLLYLRDRQGRWYRAELGADCFGLRWALGIGYDTNGRLTLDQGGHILVGRERCPILSLTRSEGPPRKKKH